MINQIQDDTGADITIEDDGTIYIGATDGAEAEAARAMINADRQPDDARGRRALPRHGREDHHLRRLRLADARQGRPAAHLADPQARRRQAGGERRGRRSASATRSRSRSPRSTSAASSSLIPVVDGEDDAADGDAEGRVGQVDDPLHRRDGPPLRRGAGRRTRTAPARCCTGTDGAGRCAAPCCPAACGSSPRRCPAVRSATFGIWVGVGSRDETPALGGATHYLEHLLFKGTERRSALDISAALDAVGGEMNAFTAKEYTCYYARVLDTDLPLAVDVLSDMVTSSLIRQDDVDAERGVILEEIAMTDDDPGDVVHDLFATRAARRHPAGPPGPRHRRDRSTRSTRDQVARFYRRHYDPTRPGRGRRRQPRPRRGRPPGRAAPSSAAGRTARRRRRPQPRPRRRPRAAHRRPGRGARPARPSRPTWCSACRACPHRRPALGAGRAQRGARRRHELAAVPGGPREARAGLLGLLLHLAPTPTAACSACTPAASRARCREVLADLPRRAARRSPTHGLTDEELRARHRPALRLHRARPGGHRRRG